ncbi:Antimicrobial protein MiAMP1 [Macleaya cordata]|uniref:Antimicrobial protein MiAMP1 n=1 Tax=Macleaya cordata TaxID=56857 RepID=A0A200Q2I8_MACCD|nr:Antimicrobial protein MiAMP1 [Macleaya cordata]
MAAANKISSILIMALVFVALVTETANASSLTVWSGPGCNNRAERYSKCGCSAIKQHGGYEFVYNGQTAALYNQGGCSGVAHTRFNAGARACSPFGWKSIFIQC